MATVCHTAKRILVATIVSACTWVPASAIAAVDTWALVIGIDKYDHVRNLEGAVNDADDITDSLTGKAKRVVVLRNHEATRERIFNAWDELVSASAPGDMLILTFAGHGAQEDRARDQTTEEDLKDEVFLLSRFAPNEQRGNEKIFDDEINMMLSKAQQRTVLFVADSCHSGTMTRSIDERIGLGTRLVRYAPAALPPAPSSAEGVHDPDLDHVVFLAAVEEAEVVPELIIGEDIRGALSWSVANALRGEADTDGDAAVSVAELETYVSNMVHVHSLGAQSPTFDRVAQDGTILFEGVLETRPPPSEEPDPAYDRRISVRLMNATPDMAEQLKETIVGAKLAADNEEAEFVYDIRTGEVLSSRIGHAAWLTPGSFDLSAIEDLSQTRATMNRLLDLERRRSVSVRLGSGHHTYGWNQEFSVVVTGDARRNVIALSVTARGEIAYLYPLEGAGFNDPFTIPPSGVLKMADFVVREPFGEDFFLVLTSKADLSSARERLREIDGTRSLLKLEEVVADLQSADLGIGITAIFTRP